MIDFTSMIYLILAFSYVNIGSTLQGYISAVVQAAMPKFPSEIKMIVYILSLVIWPVIIVLAALVSIIMLPFSKEE